jgi:hypothetical protein
MLVRLDGVPREILPSAGQALGQFLERCENVRLLYLEGDWPVSILQNTLEGNTTISAIAITDVSSFSGPPASRHRSIRLPPWLDMIVILQPSFSPLELSNFYDTLLPSDGQSLAVATSGCESLAGAYLPWPRPLRESGKGFLPLTNEYLANCIPNDPILTRIMYDMATILDWI